MRMRQGSEVVDQDRRRLLTAAATGFAAAAAAGTAAFAASTALAASSIRSRSLFGRSARDGRRHGGESPEPTPYGENGQHWPGARYDQNGYYIDPNSPGRW